VKPLVLWQHQCCHNQTKRGRRRKRKISYAKV
jgi:hypothetical protein